MECFKSKVFIYYEQTLETSTSSILKGKLQSYLKQNFCGFLKSKKDAILNLFEGKINHVDGLSPYNNYNVRSNDGKKNHKGQ